MSVTVEMMRDYLGLLPDEDTGIVKMCLDAAKSKAREAGIPMYKSNAQYDMFICALAGCLYDNRNLSFANPADADNVQRMINQYVIELRYAGEDEQGSDAT